MPYCHDDPKVPTKATLTEHIEVEMKEGGLAVCDAHLDFTVIKGIIVTIAFAVEEELVEWAKMRLPNLPNFKKKVATIMRVKIEMCWMELTVVCLSHDPQ
ncbi:MAG: hypothetical protein M1840_000697 [Geoglossum simile]|nr:MAG: hypothetical protein M1840_000697 [Geoglossum simile]